MTLYSRMHVKGYGGRAQRCMRAKVQRTVGRGATRTQPNGDCHLIPTVLPLSLPLQPTTPLPAPPCDTASLLLDDTHASISAALSLPHRSSLVSSARACPCPHVCSWSTSLWSMHQPWCSPIATPISVLEVAQLTGTTILRPDMLCRRAIVSRVQLTHVFPFVLCVMCGGWR